MDQLMNLKTDDSTIWEESQEYTAASYFLVKNVKNPQTTPVIVFDFVDKLVYLREGIGCLTTHYGRNVFLQVLDKLMENPSPDIYPSELNPNTFAKTKSARNV